jgi:subtilase family serine protease
MAKKGIIKIFLILLVVGCTPQKRLNRIVRNNPHLLVKDTIRVVDTIVIDNYSFDTITSIEFHDTVIIQNNDRVEARYYYDTLKKEIHHYIECKSDTIVKDRFIPVEKVIIQEQTLWEKYGSLVIIALIFLIILRVFKKYF